jgi:hypothetical protein
MRKKNPSGLLGKKITKKQIEAIELRNLGTLGLLNQPPLDPVGEVRLKKMFGLLLSYGIDRNNPNCWFQLSYALASKHERGFQVAAKAGRKKKRDNERPVRDVAEIWQRKGEMGGKATYQALRAEGKYLGVEYPTWARWWRDARTQLVAEGKRAAKKAKLEKAVHASREIFIQQAMQAVEAADRKKRRN